jgi:hypothetical protein
MGAGTQYFPFFLFFSGTIGFVPTLFGLPMHAASRLTRAQALARLECPADATPQDALTAYRRLRKRWHPDVCPDPRAHERFIALQEARDRLDAWLSGEPDEESGAADVSAAVRARRAARAANARAFEAGPDPFEGTAFAGQAARERAVRGPAWAFMRLPPAKAGKLDEVFGAFSASLWLCAADALDEGCSPADVALALGFALRDRMGSFGPAGPTSVQACRVAAMLHEALWTSADARLPSLLPLVRREFSARGGSPELAERLPLAWALRAPAGAGHGPVSFWLPRALLAAERHAEPRLEMEWVDCLARSMRLGHAVEALEERQEALWRENDGSRPFALRLAAERPSWFGPLAMAGWFDFAHPLYASLRVDPWSELFASPGACATPLAAEWIRRRLSLAAIGQRVAAAPAAAQPALAALFEPELRRGGGWRELPRAALSAGLLELLDAQGRWRAAERRLRADLGAALARAFLGSRCAPRHRIAGAIAKRDLGAWREALARFAPEEAPPAVGEEALGALLAWSAYFDADARPFAIAALADAQAKWGERLWEAKGRDALSAGRWRALSSEGPLPPAKARAR